MKPEPLSDRDLRALRWLAARPGVPCQALAGLVGRRLERLGLVTGLALTDRGRATLRMHEEGAMGRSESKTVIRLHVEREAVETYRARARAAGATFADWARAALETFAGSTATGPTPPVVADVEKSVDDVEKPGVLDGKPETTALRARLAELRSARKVDTHTGGAGV